MRQGNEKLDVAGSCVCSPLSIPHTRGKAAAFPPSPQQSGSSRVGRTSVVTQHRKHWASQNPVRRRTMSAQAGADWAAKCDPAPQAVRPHPSTQAGDQRPHAPISTSHFCLFFNSVCVGEKVGQTRGWARNPHHQLGPVRVSPPTPTSLGELFNAPEHEEKGAGCRLFLPWDNSIPDSSRSF